MFKYLAFVMSLLVLVFCSDSLAKEDEATILSVSNCIQNCIEVSRVGGSMLIKWKGTDGSIVKVISRDVPKGVSLVNDTPISAQLIASKNIYGTTSGTSTGGSATTTTYTYVTATEIVVVVVTIFYDANGRILDVKTTEHRTKHSQQER